MSEREKLAQAMADHLCEHLCDGPLGLSRAILAAIERTHALVPLTELRSIRHNVQYAFDENAAGDSVLVCNATARAVEQIDALISREPGVVT